MPDADLVELAVRGAPQLRQPAFDTLYYRYLEPVHGYAYRELGNREEAEDATSDVFHDLSRSLVNYQPLSGTSFRSWLFTIAHHIIVDHRARQLREMRRSEPLDPSLSDSAPSPTELVLVAEAGGWIRGLLALLPTRERQVIEFDLSGLRTVEIAATLGLSSGAVHTARCRALDRLHRHLVTTDAPEEQHATNACMG